MSQSTAADTPASSESEAQFAELLRDIWRAVTRASRSMGHLPTLPPSHAAAVRALLVSDGLTPTQLAQALDLSRPTVSELIRRLEQDGLVVRVPSTTDKRSVVLVPTKRAGYVHQAFRRGVTGVVTDAFSGLSEEDARRLLSTLPSLGRLLERVEGIADAAEEEAAERRQG
jgi:DNA-binding MarR family transcriptional regulator